MTLLLHPLFQFRQILVKVVDGKRFLSFDYIRDRIERDMAKHGNNPVVFSSTSLRFQNPNVADLELKSKLGLIASKTETPAESGQTLFQFERFGGNHLQQNRSQCRGLCFHLGNDSIDRGSVAGFGQATESVGE